MLDEHADRAATVLDVLVAVEHAVGRLEHDDAAERDVLAEPRRELGHVLAHRLSLEGELGELLLALVERRDA